MSLTDRQKKTMKKDFGKDIFAKEQITLIT